MLLTICTLKQQATELARKELESSIQEKLDMFIKNSLAEVNSGLLILTV